MRILLIGSGAREHCLAETIMRSKREPALFSFMSSNNPGIRALSKKVEIGNLDTEPIVSFAEEHTAELAVIGPEAPLAAGVVDALEKSDVPSFGPTKELAQLETSKAFTRNIMQKYDVPGLPRFTVFTKTHRIAEFIESLPGFVVKPDGLTGGKGVKVGGEHLNTVQDAVDYCAELIQQHGTVVVEEKVVGEEFSLQSITDGSTVIDCPCAQDHKRAFENDEGPNTGGMGSYSMADHSLPFLQKADVQQAHEITVKMAAALKKETGEAYKGVMYGGFMATRDGVKVLEYNARFGDPEAMNVLPLLETDFIDICRAVVDGTLDTLAVQFKKKATVCKYAVPKGYPSNPTKNQKIGAKKAPQLYYAAVDQRDDGLYLTGSRAVACVGIADTIEKAEEAAEEQVSTITGPVFHRADIGTTSLINKRIGRMKEL